MKKATMGAVVAISLLFSSMAQAGAILEKTLALY